MAAIPRTGRDQRAGQPAADQRPAGQSAARTVAVTAPHSPAWDRARRRVDLWRSLTGRVATVAGTAAAVAVLIHPSLAAEAVLATGAVTAMGAGILRLSAPFAGHQKATATTLYAVPGVALAVLLAAEYAVAGASWGGRVPMELLAIGVWAGGTWLARPARVARHMVTPRPPAAPAPVVVAPADHVHPAARWWADRVAVKSGPAVGTVLEGIEQTGERSMTAIVRAAEYGKPVPDISVRHLSALLDLPEDQIAIKPVPGRGAGVRRLTVGPELAEVTGDPTTVWAEKIAPMAMPGAVLTGIRVGKPGTPTAPEPADTAPVMEDV
jgi:hypothetical protein